MPPNIQIADATDTIEVLDETSGVVYIFTAGDTDDATADQLANEWCDTGAPTWTSQRPVGPADPTVNLADLESLLRGQRPTPELASLKDS